MNTLAESLEPPVPEEEIKAAEVEAEKVETPEVKPETPEDETKPEKLVRLEALHEERGKRKELAKQLEIEKRERAAFEARMNERISQLYQSAQPQPQLPDPNDPLAVHQHQIQEQGRVLQQLAHAKQQDDYQRQEQERVSGLVNWAKAQAGEYAAETPDFGEAYKHMRTHRFSELQAMGLSPQEIHQTLVRDELWVYDHAHQTGQNPGEVIYKMAKNTGYKPKGTAPEEKMENLQKGVKASTSLSGGVPAATPTPEQIANMSDEDFAALKKDLSKKGKRVSDVL